MASTEDNLYKRIQAVANDIRNIEKNMTVGSGNYAYRAVQDIDVTLAVKEAETRHGLVSIPIKQELVRSEVLRVMKDRGGEAIQYVDIVKMTLRIINTDNPTEFIDVESFGRGLDSGDKGFGKASTYARKYALLNAYKIATGEDPDAERSKEMTAAPERDTMRETVTNYMMKHTDYLQNILSYFNVGTVDDLNKEQIQKAYNSLKKKGEL